MHPYHVARNSIGLISLSGKDFACDDIERVSPVATTSNEFNIYLEQRGYLSHEHAKRSRRVHEHRYDATRLSVALGGKRALRRRFQDVVAWGDVASLFAPSVVEACVGRRAHEIAIGEVRFTTLEVQADRDGTLRELYGSLVPLGVATDAHGAPIVCPGRACATRADSPRL